MGLRGKNGKTGMTDANSRRSRLNLAGIVSAIRETEVLRQGGGALRAVVPLPARFRVLSRSGGVGDGPGKR
jgi:hypothetical protein